MSSKLVSIACAAALAAPLVHAQQVHVVGPEIVPGVQFTVIQDAVDAAVDGDVILVRPGFYREFTISQKALVVAGDAPSRVRVGGIGVRVEDTAAGQSVVVRNFEISGAMDGVVVSGCAGPVAFEDCEASVFSAVLSANGAVVSASSHVSFTRCILKGGLQRGAFPAPGLFVTGGEVHLHSSSVIGAAANGTGTFDGAAGARLILGGSLHATKTTFQGGAGAPVFPPFCFSAGTGGDALYVAPPGSADLLDCVLAPGTGTASSGCPGGPSGQPISGTGTVNLRAGVTGTLSGPSPVRAGQPLPLQLTGSPGDLILLAASTRQAPMFFAPCNGTIHPDLTTGIVQVVGLVPASGQLTLALQVPANLGALAVTLHMQTVLGRPTGCFVADPVSLLLLDSSL